MKFKTGQPFDPNDFDLDAFIVSDEIAEQFGKQVRFRNARDLFGFTKLCDEIEGQMKTMYKGYRTSVEKPFTFRIFTTTEFEKLQGGYKIIE